MIEYRWNRIGLNTPDAWEPASLERDSLLLEEDGRPVCELKWRIVQGRFSFEKHLRRLAKRHRGVEVETFAPSGAPTDWRDAMNHLEESGLQLQSFTWRHEDRTGIGAALHNPGTGMAALIQFFPEGEEDAAGVLASFRDHSSGKTIPWTMFGISARVPADFMLHTFSFKPGHFTVRYWKPKSRTSGDRIPPGKGRGTALVFERFAPASVLLKNISLEGWIRDNLEGGLAETLSLERNEDSIAWAGNGKSSLLRTILRRQEHTLGLVRVTDTNAILAIRTSGVIPLDTATFSEIAHSYAVV